MPQGRSYKLEADYVINTRYDSYYMSHKTFYHKSLCCLPSNSLFKITQFSNFPQTEKNFTSKMAKDQMIRSVGVISGIGLTAGTMIGSGIFMSPGDVLDSSGIFLSL